MKKGVFLYLFFVLTAVSLTACSDSQSETEILLKEQTKQVEQTTDFSETEVSGKTTNQCTIYVYICGEVKYPDVYELLEGSRVKDAVQKAGGFNHDADEKRVNLARQLSDGEQIIIPKKGEDLSENQEFPNESNSESQQKININTATKEQLMSLSGIGEAKAEAIIAYREEHGAFRSIDELKEIRGIKDGVFQKVKDLITIH